MSRLCIFETPICQLAARGLYPTPSFKNTGTITALQIHEAFSLRERGNYMFRFICIMFLTSLIFINPVSALELAAGKYIHTFADGTCGSYTVNNKSRFTKYEYGTCDKKPSYVTNTIRVRGTTLKSGAVTISSIKKDARCFWGTWQWQQHTIPNKRFCRG